MVKVTVKERSGQTHIIDCQKGLSLMENLRDNGVDDIMAICGGNCACGTCHVYVESDHLEELSELSGDEADLLDAIMSKEENSRLSCQIIVDERLEGLTVSVAPEA